MCTISLSEKHPSRTILVVEKLGKILSAVRAAVTHKDSIGYVTDRFTHMNIIFWPGNTIVVCSGMTGMIKNVLNLKLVVSSLML